MSSLRLTHATRRWIAAGCVLGSLATVVASRTAAAQGGMVVTLTADGAALFGADHQVRITPAQATIDEKKTVTLEFINPSDDTLTTTILVGLRPPRPQDSAEAAKPSDGGGLIADDSSAKPAATSMDSVPAAWSLAPWLKGLPTKIKLLPHEKKSVVVHLAVPPKAAPGDYAAWVLTSTDAAGPPKSVTLTTSDGQQMQIAVATAPDDSGDGKKPAPPKPVEAGAKLSYHVGQ